MTRQEAYDLATNAGHTPAKALEIAIDYERGVPFALQWMDMLVKELALLPDKKPPAPSVRR